MDSLFESDFPTAPSGVFGEKCRRFKNLAGYEYFD